MKKKNKIILGSILIVFLIIVIIGIIFFKNDMFKNCAETEGTFTLADSKKSLSFACYNKGTSIDGGRFNKQFYDDVTQSDDRENVNAHMKDRGKYNSQWKKRQYDEFSVNDRYIRVAAYCGFGTLAFWW